MSINDILAVSLKVASIAKKTTAPPILENKIK